MKKNTRLQMKKNTRLQMKKNDNALQRCWCDREDLCWIKPCLLKFKMLRDSWLKCDMNDRRIECYDSANIGQKQVPNCGNTHKLFSSTVW